MTRFSFIGYLQNGLPLDALLLGLYTVPRGSDLCRHNNYIKATFQFYKYHIATVYRPTYGIMTALIFNFQEVKDLKAAVMARE